MNYFQHRSQPFDRELFQNPPSQFRAAPFWAWNNRLDPAQLNRQIACFQSMGFGGFHMHPRTGLDTEYLGQDHLGCIRSCMEEARSRGMKAYLYDEDRWPSGFAGGLVTQDESLRAKQLLWTCRPYGTVPLFDGHRNWFTRNHRTENGHLLGCYDVVLKDGQLHRFQLLDKGQLPEPAPLGEAFTQRLWYAYLETEHPIEWFNGHTYVDTLNEAAIARFIEITHERFAREFGADFGGLIPSIFTDEPQFIHKQSLSQADSTADVYLPFTNDLFESFAATYGQRLEEHLPELFWELPNSQPSLARYRYHEHVGERFTRAFSDQVGDWCSSHNLLLTGHIMEEPTLTSQTAALGEAMRSYRSFGLPGIDILCDSREYTTAKQAQSVARQFGKPGVASELYGVTGWDFTFAGHKCQGDWQAALGVVLRVPHLAWVSMEGEAKRDYPASIGYQSPWAAEYKLVEDHFARVNSVLTRGEAQVRVGVIHPIESFWLCFGPQDQTGPEREERETAFRNLTDWLLFGLVDFDFISESLLSDLCPQAGAPIRVGEMTYHVLIVPGMRTIRRSTLERLEAFAASGGTLVFLGEIPSLVDGELCDAVQALADRSLQLPFSRSRLLETLKPYRDLKAEYLPAGQPREHEATAGESLLYQWRRDGENGYLFVCNTHRTEPCAARLELRGNWNLTQLDTITGETHALAATVRNGHTYLEWHFPAHGHLLLQLTPHFAHQSTPKDELHSPTIEVSRLTGPVPITLSEPNVLVLDQAEYRFLDADGQSQISWQPRTELLRIENLARTQLGLPFKHGEIVQPWADTDPAPIVGYIELKFEINSRIAVTGAQLALERPELAEATWNGEPLTLESNGWWVDEAIQTVAVPDFESGNHELLLRWPVTRKSNLEWCYLLGDFGVQVRGSQTQITDPVRELSWGDWTSQGLPFYAGNVTYHTTLPVSAPNLSLNIPHFSSPLLSVDSPETNLGKIAFAPFTCDLSDSTENSRLGITAFGNRFNAFGALHNCDPGWTWHGPPSWRTTGPAWSDEYQLKPMGILTAPILEAPKI